MVNMVRCVRDKLFIYLVVSEDNVTFDMSSDASLKTHCLENT